MYRLWVGCLADHGTSYVLLHVYELVLYASRAAARLRLVPQFAYEPTIIQNGVRWTGMPTWKEEHTPEETWNLVAFLRRAPMLTEADLQSEEAVATSGERPAAVSEGRSHRHP
jgi:hypothetical protein